MSALHIYRQGLLVGYRDFRDFWNLRSWLFGWMLRILTNAFAWVLLGRVLASEARVHFLLVGNAVAAGSAAALWASNATTWARFDGTHPLLVIAPSGLLSAVVGRTSIWLLNGVCTSLLTLSVLLLSFGHRPPLSALLVVPPLIVLVCSSTFGFALCMGALLSNRKQYRNLALDVTGMLMMALCGVSVPLHFWPTPVPQLVSLLPMTHGLLAIRGALQGESFAEIAQAAALELLVGAGWFSVALLSIRKLFDRGRLDGSIEDV